MNGMNGWVVPGFAEERQLGSGASGHVVAAVHVASGTRVAVKYLSPKYFKEPVFLDRFRGEAQLLRSISSPHVVRLFDYVEAPGQGAAIVMEMVSGVSLHEMITRQGPASPESALAALKGSLLGLAAAHAVGIVHRDYKPENILVDPEGTSKLTDFGIAVLAGQDALAAGTALYMAPEQWDGTPATPAADIYAATAVFYECLTGTTPFSGGRAQLATQHATAAVPVESVDEPLRGLIARGMAKDPAARPASAAALVSELETTAAAAYGRDWESRGTAQLAVRAAAMLALLLHSSAAASAAGTAAGTGTTNVTTTLGHARRAANITRRALSAGHGTGGAVAGAAVAAAVVVALLPSGHKPAPPPPAPAPVVLNGDVMGRAAFSGSDAWMVGCAPLSTCAQTWTAHFNGTTWTQVPSPSPGPETSDELGGVTVLSASNAWAVGVIINHASSKSLILHWNGTAWTQVPSPSPGTIGNQLYGVAATSANDVWAVGVYTGVGVGRVGPGGGALGFAPLILHWNGTAWTQVPSPPGVQLLSVAAVSADNAWAVGTALAPVTSHPTTLILHWDGATWTRVPSPNGAGRDNSLSKVVAAPDGTAWALGTTQTNPGLPPSILMRWDGSTWQMVPVPGGAYLSSLAVASGGLAWAGGCTADKSAQSCSGSLMLRWNGTSLVSVPTPARTPISGVFAFSPTDALAISETLQRQTLIMRWNGKTWQ
jgi:serine/threonine-protein kinase